MSILPKTTSKDKSPKLILRFSQPRKTEKVPLADLRSAEYITQLDDRVRAKLNTVKVTLSNLADWPEDDRLHALRFLARYDDQIEFIADPKGAATRLLFDAILSAMPGKADLGRHVIVKTIALEVAALLYPQALETACDRLADRFKELGIKGATRRDLLVQAKKICAEVDDDLADLYPEEATLLTTVFADLPVSLPLVTPPGWELNTEGISRCGHPVRIPTPVLITALQVHNDDSTELVTLAWRRDGGWSERGVERGAIASTRSIVEELARYGILVNSNNAQELVQFLMEFEAVNRETLPLNRVSRQLGWQGEDGKDGFLLGRQLIEADYDVEAPENSKAKDQSIQFVGSDVGDDQIADGFHTRGDFQTWVTGIRVLQGYPQVMLALFASLTAPLLEIFGSPNFLVSLAGRTSCGKTAALRIAASCWGNPYEQDPHSVVKVWSGTATWRERVPAVLNNLPFLLDDTKHALQSEDVAKTIYSVAQGVGKGRGSVKGLAKQSKWRTVAIITGEQPLTSFTKDGGTRVRVLSFWGSPFGAIDPHTGVIVSEADATVRQNFGHAGPRLIHYILSHRGKWDGWCKKYQEEVKRFEGKAAAEGNPFAGRMATYFAAITTTARLVHEAGIFDWDYSDPVEPLWAELCSEAGEANQATAALRYVVDWANSHKAEFLGRRSEEFPPNGGWAGMWKTHLKPKTGTTQNRPWKSIDFYHSKLCLILIEGGFEPDSILRSWCDENWLYRSQSEDGKKRRTVKRRTGKDGGIANMIAIKRTAIDSLVSE